MSPMPMLVPELEVPATKAKVVPLTTSVSLVAIAVARSLDEVVPVPDSTVAVVIATAVPVLSLLTTEPVDAGRATRPSRLLAVAPVRAAEVTLDFVEYPVGVCSTWLAIDLALATSPAAR